MRNQHTAENRLTKQAHYDAVRKGGFRKRCPSFVFQALVLNDPQVPQRRRLGVIASRKTGNSVKRSRAKRIFREIFRQNKEALPVSCDVVIVVFSNFDTISYKDQEAFFLKCCNLIKNG
jgi:ribonuclease P protein component